MSTKKKVINIYKDKYFYKIKKSTKGIRLVGPDENIRFLIKRISKLYGGGWKYKFAEVVEGKIVRAFTENEILVTNRQL